MTEQIDRRAALWHQAQMRDDVDWHLFAAWLDSDPRHRAAYDEIALLDVSIDLHRARLKEILPESTVQPQASRLGFAWIATGFAAAAAIAATIMLSVMPEDRTDSRKNYVTPIGHRRTIVLADGSSVRMDPGSLLVAGHRGDAIDLSGSATFEVRHDARHPLLVRANGFEIRDVGTRFEVKTGGDAIRVAVSDGRVAVRSRGVAGGITLDAGQAMAAFAGSNSVEVSHFSSSAMPQTQSDRLVYQGVALGIVAADIARLTQSPVDVEPLLAHRKFSGTLTFGPRAKMISVLTELMNIDARSEGSAVRLVLPRGERDIPRSRS